MCLEPFYYLLDLVSFKVNIIMNTFCVLPWFSNELMPGRTTPCCLLPKDHDLVQIKQDLLAGIQTPACAKCWRVESEGQQSRRQLENVNLDYKLNRDIEQIKQDCINGTNQVVLYQITTSNLCNQACVTCDSFSSSKWAEIERKMNIVPTETFELDLSLYQLNYAGVRRIELLGGEPLFDPKTFYILEQLIAHDNRDCFISLVTNGSIALTPKMLSLLSQFTDINICVSVDGIGPVFEYMRWPAKWPQLVDNIRQYRSFAKNISISYTVSSLNVYYYDQTVAWFNANDLRYNHNMVTRPDWLSLDSMPIELKHAVHNQFVTVTGNEIPLVDYIQRLSQQELAKKIKIKDYMPEIAAIFDTE
jgi:wyosine [tRNA(Phe)-imidazoG37] synthetase (radical SAM superfamily)